MSSALLDDDLVVRRLLVRSADVVYVKGIFEASEGLCCMFAEKGGDLLIAAPLTRTHELDALLAELVQELGAVLAPRASDASVLAPDSVKALKQP